MAYIERVFGAAGTGKTTYVYENVLSKLSDAEIKNVMALSFTVAAKQALLNKETRLNERQVRTLHSICFSALNLSPEQLVSTYEIQEFMDANGYPYKPEKIFDDEMSLELVGNTLLKWWGRLHHEAPRYMLSSGKIDIGGFIKDNYDFIQMVGAKTFLDFIKKYSAYLKDIGKFDFDIILYQSFKRGVSIKGTHLILDEAQDLSPLMAAILRDNIENFENVYILGDDDQTIYSALNGAAAEFLLDYPADEDIVLQKSWRLPIRVWKLAMALITKNKRRVHKDFKPRDEEGLVKVHKDLPIDLIKQAYEDNKTTYILCRHKREVGRISRILSRQNIPHGILGYELFDSDTKSILLPALTMYDILREKQDRRITKVMFRSFFSLMTPEMRREIFGEEDWGKVSKDMVLDYGWDWYFKKYPKLRIVDKLPPEMIFLNTDISKHTIRLWNNRRKNISQWQNPKVIVGTIHQSKGLEADRVILNLKVNKYTYESRTSEYERRVWYVGITRAREELHLVMPKSGLWNEEVGYLGLALAE